MVTKLFASVVLVGSLWVAGDAAYQNIDCCANAIECCFPARECCFTDTCVSPGNCCSVAAPCCEAVPASPTSCCAQEAK